MPPALLDPPKIIAPAWRSVPEYVFTSGPEVIDVCTEVDFVPDPNQADVLNGTFGETAEGRPAAFDIGLIAARQNIKTATLQMMFMGWLFVTEERRMVYSAHEWNPACDEMFRGMKDLIGRSSWMSRKVRNFDDGKGYQKIELRSGALMFFKTRTNDTTRALTGDKMVNDEGLKLQPVHSGSSTPTLATRPMAQVVTASSAGKATSLVLGEVVDRGRQYQLTGVPDPSIAYWEWCAPPPEIACDRGRLCDHGRRTPGCGCDKIEYIVQANPAAGWRIPMTFFANARRSMPPAEYGREVMGWHDPIIIKTERPALDIERWTELEDPYDPTSPDYVEPPHCTTFGIELDVEVEAWSVGAAGRRDDGRMHLEHVDDGTAVEQIKPRCLELARDHAPAVFALDGAGPAAALIKPLRDAGLQLEVLDTAQVVAASSALMGSVNRAGSLAYVHGPQDALESAVLSSRPRAVGERGTTIARRKSGGNATPIQAVMWAAYAADLNDYDVLDSAH